MLLMADPKRIQIIRDWIDDIIRSEPGLSYAALAKRAKLAESTLTRFMSKGKEANEPRERTLLAIEKVSDVPMPATLRLSTPEPANTDDLKASYDLPKFVIEDSALDLAGYLEGDRVDIDANIQPRPGDIVAVRAADDHRRTNYVSVRIFDDTFLTSHSSKRDDYPTMLAHKKHVTILGVVTRTVRVNRKFLKSA